MKTELRRESATQGPSVLSDSAYSTVLGAQCRATGGGFLVPYDSAPELWAWALPDLRGARFKRDSDPANRLQHIYQTLTAAEWLVGDAHRDLPSRRSPYLDFLFISPSSPRDEDDTQMRVSHERLSDPARTALTVSTSIASAVKSVPISYSEDDRP